MDFRVYELPWSTPADEQHRFRRILLWVAVLTLIPAVLMPWLPVREPDPRIVEDIPPRLARLVLERRTPPPRPPPTVVEEPESAAGDVEPPVETTPPEPVPVRSARERAALVGLLPFTDELADLRESEAAASVIRPQELSEASGEIAVVERSLITSNVRSGSGGINTAALSRNTGGGSELADRETTRVASPPGGEGQGRRPGRTPEEIEMVFDRNKGAIYTLYQRALRSDPTLQGKLVLRLTIAPSGEVTDCVVLSSELNNPELERKLVARVKLFRFEAREVGTVTTTKPIEFFPA